MQKTTQHTSWFNSFTSNRPFLIAGPCSAETRQQLITTALAMPTSKVDFFRAGIWKPRTRPGGFEGIGQEALQWLQEVKQLTSMKIATEVANAKHIELALKHDIDLLWIGARTTVNPFMIQEIADALQGTDKIVLVKNPVNPDLSLWIGALERFDRANIKNLGAIHRGFSSYQKTPYRNTPQWQIAIELKNQFPNLPLIGDPSHIAGDRNLIFELSQNILDLSFDGLMIETHYSPDTAWSDAKQQITPEQLYKITNSLIKRQLTTTEIDYQQQLQKLRSQIDILDEQLLYTLKKRMEISDNIGQLKKNKNISVFQNQRWNEILSKMIYQGQSNGLSQEFIAELFKIIHQESINRQESILLEKIQKF